ncbi:MAG: hypothetical protein NTY70_16560, partial [Burkholderiales bacterium]|nr:hypothetical protein [Burkholderiales bacterium]
SVFFALRYRFSPTALRFCQIATKRFVCKQQRDEIMRHFLLLVNPLFYERLNLIHIVIQTWDCFACLTFFISPRSSAGGEL